MLASMLPDSMDAIQELVQGCCELNRNEMCARLFRVSIEKTIAGNIRALKQQSSSKAVHTAEADDSMNMEAKYEEKRDHKERERIASERDRLMQEREKIEIERRELRQEFARLEQMKGSMNNYAVGTTSTKRDFQMADPGLDNSISEENSFNNGQDTGKSASVMAQHGALALRQGVVFEKVGKNTGERIVRISGDVLEWRKGAGRFTKEHTVNRQDVVNIKIVDPQGKTFLVSTKTGLLTLRALSEPAANLFVQAIDIWVKGQQGKLIKRAPLPPSSISIPAQPTMTASTAVNNQTISRRFPRISMSFSKRPSKAENQLGIPLAGLANPLPPSRGVPDFSFSNLNLDSSLQDDE